VCSEIVYKPVKQGRLSKLNVALFASLIAGLIVIAVLALLIVYPDFFINKYVKNRITKEFRSTYPGYSIKISELHINLFKNSIEIGSAEIYSDDSTFSAGIGLSSLKSISWLQLLWNRSLFPDALASSVAETQGIVIKLEKNLYEFRCERLIISQKDSEISATEIELHPLVNDELFFKESEFRKTRYRLDLSQLKLIGIDFDGLLKGKIYRTDFIKISGASLDVIVNTDKPVKADTTDNKIANEMLKSIKEKIRIDSLSISDGYVKYIESYIDASKPGLAYECHYGGLAISVKDSELVANDFEIHPLVDDNQFFDECKFRRTRLSTIMPKLKVNGLDCRGLIRGDKYKARFIQLRDIEIDVLVNMYKPYERFPTKTLFPNEILATIKEKIHLDSMRILNGQVRYCESYSANAKPAVIAIDKLEMLARGFSNDSKNGDTAVIQATALFMGTGKSEIMIHIPLSTPNFALRYSGSLGVMNAVRLNPFLEIAEHYRVKSGDVQSLSYEIQVNDGHARGYVRGIYNNLKLALLDTRTGSEKGFMNKIRSFWANTFVINGETKVNKSDTPVLGKVRYSRNKDDTFIQYMWFAYRTGLADLLGIEIK